MKFYLLSFFIFLAVISLLLGVSANPDGTHYFVGAVIFVIMAAIVACYDDQLYSDKNKK
jgi:hypothetical protein